LQVGVLSAPAACSGKHFVQVRRFGNESPQQPRSSEKQNIALHAGMLLSAPAAFSGERFTQVRRRR